ncbi:MAG: hypothetical protein ABJC89_05935 [Acidobacteriota bacterium]
MKRSITRWTTTLATAALLAAPVMAQTPSPQQPPTQQQPPAHQPPEGQPPTAMPPTERPANPQPPMAEPARPTASPQAPTGSTSSSDAAVSPQEHLRLAKAALDSISSSAVTGRARTQIADLKKHMSALEKASSSAPTADRSPSAPPSKATASVNWGTEVAAIDKILTDLTTSDAPTATTGAPSANAPTGTSGTAAKAPGSVALDAETAAKLKEVRAHVVAYATAMSAPKGAVKEHEQATTAGDAPAAAPAAAPSAAPAAAAEAGAAAMPTASQNAAATPEAQSNTAATSPSPAQSPATASNTAAPQGDSSSVRQHLSEARDTLAEMTKLPAAAQLQGDARNQVAQLISTFNELITTQSNWKASYAKVQSSLAALLGSDTTDAAMTAASPSPAPAANAPAGSNPSAGATAANPVGTAGAAKAELDPAIRAKLVDLRRNLSEFEKAATAATK